MDKMLARLYELRAVVESIMEDSDTLEVPQEQLALFFRYSEALEAGLDLVNVSIESLDAMITESTEEGYEQF